MRANMPLLVILCVVALGVLIAVRMVTGMVRFSAKVTFWAILAVAIACGAVYWQQIGGLLPDQLPPDVQLGNSPR